MRENDQAEQPDQRRRQQQEEREPPPWRGNDGELWLEMPLLPVLSDLLQPIIQIVVALTPLADVLGALLLALMPILDPILQLTTMLIQLIANKTLVQALAWALTEVLKPVELLVEPLGKFGTYLRSIDWGETGRQIGGAFVDAWNAVLGFFGTIGQWMKDLPGTLLRLLGEAGTWLVEAGKNIVHGLWDGISSLGGWLWDQVGGFVKRNTVDRVKDVLDMHSPSRVMVGLGEDTVESYAMGVQRSAQTAHAAVGAAVSPAAAMSAGRMPSSAMPQTVDVRSSDPLMHAFITEMKEQIRRHFGGDPAVALGS